MQNLQQVLSLCFVSLLLQMLSSEQVGAESGQYNFDRCSRFMNALASSDIDKAVNTNDETMDKKELSEAFVAGQYRSLRNIIDYMSAQGGGKLTSREELSPVPSSDGREIIKSEIWHFPNERLTYLGCVIYKSSDGDLALTLRMEDSESKLIDALNLRLSTDASHE